MPTMLILDDDQFRHKQFKQKYINMTITHVETVQQSIKALTDNEFDYVCLDHDLGGEQMVASGYGTGYEVAVWLTENLNRAPKQCVYVHSLNPAGRKNICDLLNGVGIIAIPRPFMWAE